MDVFDGQIAVAAGAGGHHIAVGILQRDGDLALACDPGPDVDPAGFAVDGGGHGNAGAAVVIQVKVVFVDGQQEHIPVDAAVEGEIRLLGIDPVIFGVVHLHDHVVLFLQMIGDVGTEGGVAAVMGHDDGAVEDDLCRGVDAVELQINQLILPVSGHGEGLFVNAGAAPVVIAAVLTVQVVPGVGDVQTGFGAVMVAEEPVCVEDRCFAHGFLLIRRENLSPGGERFPGSDYLDFLLAL